MDVNTGCVNSQQTINVELISSYVCPTKVDKTNWLTDVNHNDAFGVTTDGDSITVTRTDGGGNGWCMSLSFQCCTGVHFTFIC